ncbi:hypothetical protein [Pseudomonas mohnii]
MSTPKNFELKLRIDIPFDTTGAKNTSVPKWPLPPDFPIIIDELGNVVSRYSDSRWYLWPWAKSPTLLNFGDGQQRNGASLVSTDNADILRCIAAWLIYSPSGANRASTLLKYITDLKPFFVTCTKNNILGTDLLRYPNVIESISSSMKSDRARALRSLLHLLWEWREEIGFVLLDPPAIKQLLPGSSPSRTTQTAYIPPRIWTYQVNRLRELLIDFLENQESIEHCYARCMELYTKNYGGLTNAFGVSGRSPFSKPRPGDGRRNKPDYAGPFSATAKEFGIHELLMKWIGDSEKGLDGPGRGVTMLSSFLTLTTHVGIAYILNFSMMRIKEAWDLRSDCLKVENDKNFGPIYILSGASTKTIDDDDARWVTSPSTQLAVDALRCIAKLRMKCAIHHPTLIVEQEDLDNPWLVCRSYEPWAGAVDVQRSTSVRPNYPAYKYLIELYPKLFDLKHLAITEKDLEIARQVTIGLDCKKYAVGEIWSFGWHQLRRTGAVNMQGSDLVSDPSAQYQLKHATRAMSLYYGKGYSAVRLNKSARNEFLEAMYEMLSMEIKSLSSQKFISLSGNDRKDSLLQPLRLLDAKELEQAIKKGSISWRQTLLGGCMKNGPCPYGGVDNIIRCGGGDGRPPCADGLVDVSHETQLQEFHTNIEARIDRTVAGSPLHQSLLAQKTSVDNALKAINSQYD